MKDMDNEESIELVQIALNPNEQIKYNNDRAYYNKIISNHLNEARKRAKQEKCYICQKEVSSFCNSHSVPQFCLKAIATDGKVFMSGIQPNFPCFGDDTGVKSAGTFHIICRECDNTIFKEYENPLLYDNKPTGQMLAQIAMKNYLQMIYKRKMEQEFYSIIEENSNKMVDAGGAHEIKELDLKEYIAGCNRAKIAAGGHHNDWYYLCYYVKLDYTVPLAFQGQIALICDFDDKIINNIYNSDKNYEIQNIHIAVFPFKDKSIVFAFVDSRNKRYANFYKKLRKLELIEQLSTINYIIFKYSENVFLSKKIPDYVFKDESFINVCGSTSEAKSKTPYFDPLPKAIEEFSLNKHKSIPNLLSPEYAIK